MYRVEITEKRTNHVEVISLNRTQNLIEAILNYAYNIGCFMNDLEWKVL